MPVLENARRAIETARLVLGLTEPGPVIIHRGPRGELHCDIPLMYQGFALDRIHYDPWRNMPLPKGAPHIVGKVGEPEILLENLRGIVSELRVLDAAEFRGPERAWAVPVAWKTLLVAYIKIDEKGEEVVPDYPLTDEVMRRV